MAVKTRPTISAIKDSKPHLERSRSSTHCSCAPGCTSNAFITSSRLSRNDARGPHRFPGEQTTLTPRAHRPAEGEMRRKRAEVTHAALAPPERERPGRRSPSPCQALDRRSATGAIEAVTKRKPPDSTMLVPGEQAHTRSRVVRGLLLGRRRGTQSLAPAPAVEACTNSRRLERRSRGIVRGRCRLRVFMDECG